MIIDWTQETFQTYIGLGYIDAYSGGIEVQIIGEMAITFTAKQPEISYTSRKPNITFS